MKFEPLDFGLSVQILSNTQTYILLCCMYEEFLEGNLGNKKWWNYHLIGSKRNHHLRNVEIICLALSLSAGNETN